MINRRSLFASIARTLLVASLPWAFPSMGAASGVPEVSLPEAAQRLQGGGWVLMMRHAVTVPGVGDPPEFRLDDCSSQRNLSAAGREQARRAGEAMRSAGIRIDEVRTSRWCRARDTARLAFGTSTDWPALDSFFAGRGDGQAQAEQVRAWSRELPPGRNVMLVTHQVNISAVMGPFAAQGEVIAGRPGAAGIDPVFRFLPD